VGDEHHSRVAAGNHRDDDHRVPTDTGPIDYVARWRTQIEARHDQGRRLDQQHNRPDVWAGRAQRFARYVAETAEQDPLLRRLLARVDEHTSVLDVGAGPGRHAVPLAGVASHVTAVEPSEAMRGQLEANVEDAGLTNVRIVAAEWPDMPVEPADVVVCSHVLYPVVEIEPFLRALDAATRGACYTAMRLGQREEAFLPLFEQVWDEPRVLAPTAIDVFNVCHQIGIPANFEVVPFQAWRDYGSIDEAVEQLKSEVLNPADPAADAKIRAFAQANLRDRDGRLVLDIDAPRAAIVWWEK
jgi:SAM-dependent methyltransferase